jgi:hypothetical protein
MMSQWSAKRRTLFLKKCHPKTLDEVFNIFPQIRVHPQDIGSVRLSIPVNHVEIVKEKLDNSDLFLSILPYQWIYLGYWPFILPQMGMMTFGDIYLSPSGQIKGDAMTTNHIKNLIRELKHVCAGIPIIDAKLKMQPSQKLKMQPEENDMILLHLIARKHAIKMQCT